PAVGDWLMDKEPGAAQLSLATTWERRLGTAAWQFAPDEAVIAPGQERVGGVTSRTVTTTLASDAAPQGSVTRRVTTLVPSANEPLKIALVPRTFPATLHW